MDHAHYQLWLKRVLNPAFWQFFSGHCLGLTQKPWLCFQGRIAIANFSPKNVVMSTTFLGVVFFTCYFFPIFYVKAWGRWSNFAFWHLFEPSPASFPHLLGDDFTGTWRDFLWEFQIGLDISPHFQKKQEHAFWPCIFPATPPARFFGSILNFSQRPRHFPEWGLWSSSGPSDSQCPSFCSSRPPMPPRRGTVKGGVVKKIPKQLRGETPGESRKKKEWHKFLFTPEIGRMRMNSQEEKM